MSKQLVISIFILIFYVPISVYSQDNGIKFESGLSWNEIKLKAKAENKYIFMDCYATWCGPCKWMSQNVFTQKEIGDYFNSHFVCVAVQMDHTTNDFPNIQHWYADAKNIEREYSVESYPTYLFFSPEGSVVHRLIGSGDAKTFIDKAKEAFNPDKQYYANVIKYKEHSGDSAFLRKELLKAISATDHASIEAIGNEYISCLKRPISWDNLELIEQSVTTSRDRGFPIFLNNTHDVDMILGKGRAEGVLASIIFKEEVEPLFLKQDVVISLKIISNNLKEQYANLTDEIIVRIEQKFRNRISHEIHSIVYAENAPPADWKNIVKMLKRKLPGYDFDQIVLEEKPRYYWKKKLWRECGDAAKVLMRKYGDRLGAREINNIAWDYVFEHSMDRRLLFSALKWSKRTIGMGPEQYANYDTYANLLYKAGYKTEALIWEGKAIEKLNSQTGFNDPSSLREFKDGLEKMKRGDKTWFDDTSVSKN